MFKTLMALSATIFLMLTVFSGPSKTTATAKTVKTVSKSVTYCNRIDKFNDTNRQNEHAILNAWYVNRPVRLQYTIESVSKSFGDWRIKASCGDLTITFNATPSQAAHYKPGYIYTSGVIFREPYVLFGVTNYANFN